MQSADSPVRWRKWSRLKRNSMNARGDVTILLERVARGDAAARNELMPVVYQKLRQLAANHLRRENRGHTLQPTALVHEAYLRLVNSEEAHWRDRAHFFAMASRMMRHILVDHARAKRAAKRGAAEAGEDLERYAAGDFDLTRVLAIDAALHELARLSERQCQVVEMRFFGDLTEEEIGMVLNLSTRTVKRDWTMAKAWLRDYLEPRAKPSI
jgi:RNA polymerase sigma factor (TIGR02999 family)